MADVFVSYSRQDGRSFAHELAQRLGAERLSVWWDEKLEAGDQWHPIVVRQLDSAKAVAVVWTKAAVASDWVKHEASRAADRAVPIVTGGLAAADVPTPYQHLQVAEWSNLKQVVDSILRKVRQAYDAEALHSRRNFLFNALTLGTFAVAAARFTPVGDLISGKISEVLSDPLALDADCIDPAKALCLGSGTSVRMVPSYDNPHSAIKGLTKPTEWACRSLAALFHRRPDDMMVPPDALKSMNFSGDLILLGGPLANKLTRAVLGQDGRSELTVGDPARPALRFPFHFDIMRDQNAFANGIYREKPEHTPSGSTTRRAPVWVVYRDGKRWFWPDVDKDHAIRTDALVITSLPNVLHADSFKNGSRITILSGAHGTGMRSVFNLVRRRRLLEDVINRARGLTAWQAVIKIDDIDEHGKPLTLMPKFDFASFDYDFAALSAALELEVQDILSGRA